MKQEWYNNKSKQLFNAMLELKTEQEVANFLRDLLTIPEIEEFSNRWIIAQKLDKGEPQRKIASDTGTSITTVTRVNQFLKRGMDGYRLVLDRLSNNTSHHHPR